MRRETENLLLLLVGISAVMIVATGTYTRYVKPALAPWLLAASVLIITLAVAAMLRDVRRGGAESPGHTHRSPVIWLLAVPVIVLVFLTPPPIGAQAPSATAPTTVERRPFPPLPPGPVPEVAVPDVLMRMAQDSAGTLDNRRIAVTGFTVRTDAPSSTSSVDLGRVVIICCAADARLARIQLTGRLGDEVAHHPEGTWLRVEGEVPPGSRALQVYAVTEVDPPPNPYAY